MRILLINPPYQTITSNWGVGHQVPLGLLMVGGALHDEGFEVSLLDAEARHLSHEQIVQHVQRVSPTVVMSGHAGSTPAHPVCMEMFGAIKEAQPEIFCVYGGVFPTYHDRMVLREHPAVDVVIRGEGEATTAALVRAIANGETLDDVKGITFRDDAGAVIRTSDRPPIAELDRYRTGWELIEDWDRYTCFGKGRAAIVQFSRGCPHRCTYCGQHGFWIKWRRRDPEALAEEIEYLHDVHGVRFITLADENPTTHKDMWVRLLEALIERDVDAHLFATIRATDIVRDADVMHLYRQVGLLYVLMGIETTDPAVIEQVHKRSTARDDVEACRLLREHGIHSIIGHIVGLGDETWADLRRAGRALAMYDGDYLNAMYVTPHTWTAFGREQADRAVLQIDQRRWDYRHQVLEQRYLKPWQLFTAVKWLELRFHLRPRRLRRLLLSRERFVRQQGWWTAWRTGWVWVMEIADFVRSVRFAERPRPLMDWLRRAGHTEDADTESTASPAGQRPQRIPPGPLSDSALGERWSTEPPSPNISALLDTGGSVRSERRNDYLDQEADDASSSTSDPSSAAS
jgi:anaerobic magnesium-protoporphyrin IX monomethyl ester cyclase